MKIEDVSIKHQLTDSEMAALAREQAQAYDKKTTLESDLKAVTGDLKAQVLSADAAIKSISQRVHSGMEYRYIKCLLVDERPVGMRLTIRTDNGHIWKRRKLTSDERQLTITDEAPKPYAVVVVLPVDDDGWDADQAQVPLYSEEFELLRGLPDVAVQQDGKPVAQLEAGEEPKPRSKKK